MHPGRSSPHVTLVLEENAMRTPIRAVMPVLASLVLAAPAAAAPVGYELTIEIGNLAPQSFSGSASVVVFPSPTAVTASTSVGSFSPQTQELHFPVSPTNTFAAFFTQITVRAGLPSGFAWPANQGPLRSFNGSLPVAIAGTLCNAQGFGTCASPLQTIPTFFIGGPINTVFTSPFVLGIEVAPWTTGTVSVTASNTMGTTFVSKRTGSRSLAGGQMSLVTPIHIFLNSDFSPSTASPPSPRWT